MGAAIELLCLTVLLGQAEGFGGGADEAAKQEKQAMRRRIAEDRVRSRFLRREESSILDAIAEIDRGLDGYQRKLVQLGEAEKKLQKEIARADGRLGASSERLGALRSKVGRRASAMMRIQRSSLTGFLARARSNAGSRKLRDQLRLVLDYDAGLVREIKKTVDEAKALRSGLEARRRELEDAREEHATAIDDSALLREERAALLLAVRNERKMIERLAAEISVAARKLDRESGIIHGMIPPPPRAAGGFSKQKGRLPWPVAGRVEAPFGKRVDPSSGMVMAHRGLDIRAPAGELVRAVFDGEVVYADWIDGFGRVLIVAHDERWFSVYAHLDHYGARAGERIVQGRVIGVLGDSGSDKGAYLYFELRHAREAVDPMSWLSP